MEEGEFYTDPTLLGPSNFSQPPPPPAAAQQKSQMQPKSKTKSQPQPQTKSQPRKKKQAKTKKQQQEGGRDKPKKKEEKEEEGQVGPKESKTEDDNDIVTKYKDMITEFSKRTDGPDTLELPASLNSYIRMQIHEYASTIPGITHGSEGEGKGRHIVIKKTAKGGSKKEAAKTDEPLGDKGEKDELLGDEETDKETDKETGEEKKEKKEKPQKKTQQKKQQGAKNKKKGAGKGKPQGKKSQGAVSTKGLDEIDAAVLELGIDTDTEHCAYRDPKTKKRCQQKVTLIYTTCKYCNQKFCFTHVQAEVHGCGATARKQARAQVKQQYDELTKYKKMAEKKGIY